jgi:hypothetical protein
MTKGNAAALLFACSLYAESNSIFINGTEVKRGMPKPDVLALLAERNDLLKMKVSGSLVGLDAWCVKSKDDHKTPPCGGDVIQFVNDRVSRVSRKMGEADGDDAARMIGALFSSLDALAKSGKADLVFSTQEFESADHIRYRVLSFSSGGKEYTFTSQEPIGSQPTRGSSVDLTESFVRPSDGEK